MAVIMYGLDWYLILQTIQCHEHLINVVDAVTKGLTRIVIWPKKCRYRAVFARANIGCL